MTTAPRIITRRPSVTVVGSAAGRDAHWLRADDPAVRAAHRRHGRWVLVVGAAALLISVTALVFAAGVLVGLTI
jgi:hypothetical protein